MVEDHWCNGSDEEALLHQAAYSGK